MTTLAGRYHLEESLGRGGMAEVWLARDGTLGRPVAVKLLAEHVARDPELRERFLHEARFAAKLSHPNVVAVFDTGEEDGRPFIVMERVEGETLADHLRRRGALPPDEVAALGRQACAGLQHAHDAGLVHRDVKPQNLLLRDDGLLKVADFGIARAADGPGLTQAGTVLGTIAYLAPEVAAGEPATPAVDIYGLGAVLHELLTGAPPRRRGALDDALRVGGPGLPPEVPRGLREAVAACLADDPADRPASARELGRALGDEAPTDTLPFRAEDTRVLHRASRRRAPLLAVLTAVGLAVAAAAALATGGGDDERQRPVTTVVEPVPQGSGPAEDARRLAEWLRAHAGTLKE